MRYATTFILTVVFVLFAYNISAEEPRYCVAKLPTPVLNTPDIASVFGGTDGKSIKLDKNKLVREMEFIALEGTVFDIKARYPKKGYDILKVKTNDYPYDKDLYIDSRFADYASKRPPERKKVLPAMDDILIRLSSMQGAPYMWGGNFYQGINEMLEFYKPREKIDEATKSLWRLEGLDCSGLLYQAANGYTPRNTSSLVSFGKGINIAGLKAEEIANIVKPLDLIVWPGHVIIVVDKGDIIESAQSTGVKKTPLLSKLESLLIERKPVNDWNGARGKSFVIRRWHGSLREVKR